MNKNISLLDINKYFDSNKLINISQKPKKGLANNGSTCYINSIIQLLGHCFPFTLMLLSKDNESTVSEKPLLFLELKDILNLIWIEGHSLRPNKFLRALQQHFDFIDVNSQQDIDEVLLLILNRLNEELKISINIDIIEKNINNLIKKIDEAWYTYHKKEYSEIIELFYGQILVQIKCEDCKIHHSYDFFSILELEIPEKKENKKITLEDCIESYFSPFYLNDWKCEKCNEYKKNKKIHKICKLPPILFICLKRFKYKNNTNIKNDVDIEIPKNINFEKYLVSNDINTNLNYKLIGSAIHLGSSHNGHYIALFDKIIIDDTNILNINELENNNLMEKSYILLYQVSNEIIEIDK